MPRKRRVENVHRSVKCADPPVEAVGASNVHAGSEIDLRERIRALSARYKAFPATGLAADKAFFDDLSGEFTP
jgi:antitoxin VapB